MAPVLVQAWVSELDQTQVQASVSEMAPALVQALVSAIDQTQDQVGVLATGLIRVQTGAKILMRALTLAMALASVMVSILEMVRNIILAGATGAMVTTTARIVETGFIVTGDQVLTSEAIATGTPTGTGVPILQRANHKDHRYGHHQHTQVI